MCRVTTVGSTQLEVGSYDCGVVQLQPDLQLLPIGPSPSGLQDVF
jgi:hypothetical protein